MPAALDVDWGIIRTCFVAGATQAELALKFDISENSIATRSARENWAADRPENRLKERERTTNAVADIWADRAQKHRESIGRITDRLSKHVETLDDSAILAKVEKLKAFDDLARRNLGLDTQSNPTLNLAIGLLGGGIESMESVQVVSDFAVKSETLNPES